MVHTTGPTGGRYYNTIGPLSQKYSIAGFFLLSSFLLTYRLIKELHKPNAIMFISIIQYFIRRLFRIYFILMGFCILGIYYNDMVSKTLGGYTRTSLYDTLTLGYAGYGVFWTLPPELRYYFVIPVICVIFTLFKRFQWHILIICMIWTAYDQFFNFFAATWEGGVSYNIVPSYQLKNHFFVFFIGSQLGMALFLVEQRDDFINFIKQHRVQNVLILMSLLLSIYAFIYQAGLFGNKYDYRFFSIHHYSCVQIHSF